MNRPNRPNPKEKCKRFSITVFFFTAWFFSSGATAQEPSRPTVIRNVRIFDGERVIPSGTVVIRDYGISEVGQGVSIPADAEVIDGSGKTLLPGLIDAHVHVWNERQLRQSLVFGVTTVVDMFTAVETMTQIKKRQSSSVVRDMAGMITSGTLVTAPDGHGTEYGLQIPTLLKPEDAQAFVDARIAEGSDFIKIVYDDCKTYSSGSPTLDKAELTAVIRAAHKRNKIAVVHITTLEQARTAINAGADGLAHLYYDEAFDPDFGRTAARHKAFVIPTFSVLESVSGTSGATALAEDSCCSPYLTQADIAGLKKTFPFSPKSGRKGYEGAEKALRQLKAEGVPILAGTDTPNPGTAYGVSLHRELELLVQAGLTPVEALKAATSTPAEIFGLTKRGRIQSGYNADMVLVNGDPTQHIRATRDIAAIWKNGARVDRKAYRETVEREKAAAENQKRTLPPQGSESGLISDFESEGIKANFGAGWTVSTDALRGGKSTAEIRKAEGGAKGSKGSMLISGRIAVGSAYPWAGAFFSPGPDVMSPANLSSKKSVSFWAKGQGKTCYIMVFAQSLGWTPSTQTFTAGPEWTQYVFPFEKFNTDAHDLIGLFLGGGPESGDFEIYLDDVRLE
jgi:imidazolonepropionase-like amidohydrolase